MVGLEIFANDEAGQVSGWIPYGIGKKKAGFAQQELANPAENTLSLIFFLGFFLGEIKSASLLKEAEAKIRKTCFYFKKLLR